MGKDVRSKTLHFFIWFVFGIFSNFQESAKVVDTAAILSISVQSLFCNINSHYYIN